METKDTLSLFSNSKEQQMQQIKDKAKESCMVSFRQLHSHLKLLSNNDLKGTRTESGFKRAFATLFGQDIETFTGTMFLYVDQLEKQLDKEEFQEIGSMASFKVLETQFQMFIKSRIYLDDEFVTTEDKVDSSKALDASLVDTESSGTALKEQDTSSRSRNDAHADDADIRPIYDEEPMAEVQITAKINIFTGQQHTEQPEFNNEGEVDQNVEQCHDTCPLPANVHLLNPTKDDSAELGIHDHSNELSSSKLVPKVVPPADKTATSRQELELLFHHHITMLRSTLHDQEFDKGLATPYEELEQELRDNTFNGSDNEDANEHIERVLGIADLFTIPDVTQDQRMLRILPISLTRAASITGAELNE
ncbi:hypothetical protein Tco_0728111 [Tanacetum coccineum]|uniref:Uncharacterized protein n=1 Tax=Tanacetum coccineum TaxID=301880 RepID=A0ABQ4YL45_9ASTR